MNTEEIEKFVWKELTEIYRDLFSNKDLIISPEMTANDIEGWDSFRHVEILIEVQMKFNISMTSREIDNLHSIGDLFATITKKTNASRPVHE